MDRRQNPYKKCPVFETRNFILRLVRETDAEDLLECYSDAISAKFFNSDNCTSDFIYHSIDEMKECIQFWIKSYADRWFVRFSIIDKKINKAIGTIEFFAKDGSFGDLGKVGVLRTDLKSDYETQALIAEILSVIEDNFYKIFEVSHIITKAIPEAENRVLALRNNGYKELGANAIISYNSYYIK